MERVVLSVMRIIQGKIDLVKSFFQLPDTLYAKSFIYESAAKTFRTINALDYSL